MNDEPQPLAGLAVLIFGPIFVYLMMKFSGNITKEVMWLYNLDKMIVHFFYALIHYAFITLIFILIAGALFFVVRFIFKRIKNNLLEPIKADQKKFEEDILRRLRLRVQDLEEKMNAHEKLIAYQNRQMKNDFIDEIAKLNRPPEQVTQNAIENFL
jgi:flagellar biosynthesis/type III secretory pathway M-ring protein FliF/YscJ